MGARLGRQAMWVRIVLALLIAALPAAAKEDIKEKEPGPRTKGSVYAWKGKNGLGYRYYIPKHFDPKKGANLTLILHGSNLSAGWGFWNHKAGEFRADDVVVSPDGTTPNGRGGFNFFRGKKDTKRLHELHVEIKKALNLTNTYVYGHSQGSFFAFLYAGEYPKDVQGVVGHASGVWSGTQQGTRQHGQAVVLMHGTQDPVVPYFQSAYSYGGFVEKKYPHVRLRPLEGWNHWPAELNGKTRHTSQQLAWVEGMTTTDAARLAACLDMLTKVTGKDRHDYAGAYLLAQHILSLEEAPPALKKRSQKTVDAVQKLAQMHVKAIKAPDPKKLEFTRAPWVAHLPMFVRNFRGVPACDEFAKTWDDVLQVHRKAFDAQLDKFWQHKQRNPAKAFDAGVKGLQKGFLHHRGADREFFLTQMQAWRKNAKNHKLSKKSIKAYDALVPDFEKAQKDGARAFFGVNKKAPKL